MLSHLGYDSLVAETGEQALHLYQRMLDSTTPFDLVLLDMTLPGGLDGEEVLRELQRIDSSVTVIATSGYFEDGPTHSLIEMGFAGVLAKPYSMDSLAITVDQALQNRD
jgi:CheY-like chemotaxis protein